MVKTAVFLVTAYCACVLCTKHATGITKSGTKATQGRTAACAKSLLGAWINVPGFGALRCEDIGSGVQGNHVDIFMNSHREAVKWGRKPLLVEVER